mmetsp:Transcript_11593/g.29770  ORF Transcript_11593/g.29770 Transcript_11593/m.29770 type:complete len:683 (-) Transcript_11593:194-2242(-)
MGGSARVAVLTALVTVVASRPTVRNIMTNAEFNKILKHHKEKTGLPVIVDYYSDGCGPCRQIAPLYKQLAKRMKGRAVFTKVDVNWNRETSGQQMIRSMPTFQFWLSGKKKHQFSGGDPNSLQQWAEMLAKEAEKYDVQVSKEALVDFYKDVAPEKADDEAKIDEIMAKAGEGGGPGHYKLVRKLEKKYGKKPETTPAENRKPKKKGDTDKAEDKPKDKAAGPGLSTASIEELEKELAARREAEAEKKFEEADDETEEDPASKLKFYEGGDFPERVTIIGSGPAGLSAAIYASRAGLRPVVVAPPMGGQLQGKGVMVENYPAVTGSTGPAIVYDMMVQASEFGAVFEQSLVTAVDVSKRPFTVTTNTTSIQTHTIILATGADSKWLGVTGEEQYRGGGVSTCATCDGFLYRDQEVVVIGGGDTAMEDALVLARTSSQVTVVHRRDSFRASHVLAQRVLENDKITVIWNHSVDKFVGENKEVAGSAEDTPEVIDLLTHVELRDVNTGAVRSINCSAAFVAIGHKPNTEFVKDVLEMDDNGYLVIKPHSTYTTVDGVFAAGDVADKVYRQAITSAGSGAMAALDAERWLSEHGIGDEAAEFEAELLREMLAEQESETREESAYPEVQRKKETSASREKKDERKARAAERAAAAAAAADNETEDVEEEEEVVVEEEEVVHERTDL